MNSSSPAPSSSSSSWLLRAFFPRAKKKSEEKELEVDPALLRKYGVTEQLRDFLKSFTIDTFKDFNLSLHSDGQRMADDSLTKTSTKNNVQQDLTKWQEQHATLVLSTVKEISQLRYVLCPRHLKDGQFWRIYFALVKSYVAPYEMHAIREAKLKMKAMEDEKSMEKNACEVEMMEANSVTSTSLPASSEHDSDSLQFGGDEVAKAGGSDKDNLRT
ncbi:uncharacterized protein LOC131246451 isoform X3 [Magnolia sinica]|uniref:uncharacterized protein LOC131246451 isoform X3 n=1 Tax=Magnolia sinica TaxID=86752 RepID=UPI00265881E2|nr:uncharacterized protein LOC131246451 isoform X3 [Magnolia sinica]